MPFSICCILKQQQRFWGRTSLAAFYFHLWLCIPLSVSTHPCFSLSHLHGVDCDGEGRVVPVHPRLRGPVPAVGAALVGHVDAIDAQDHDDHQGGDAHHDDHSGCTRNSWRGKAGEVSSELAQRGDDGLFRAGKAIALEVMKSSYADKRLFSCVSGPTPVFMAQAFNPPIWIDVCCHGRGATLLNTVNTLMVSTVHFTQLRASLYICKHAHTQLRAQLREGYMGLECQENRPLWPKGTH